MRNEVPKISVMVITYKQEDVVGRTLDAIIAQKDFIYEICVSDDCSPDGTWQILQEYQQQHPELIKLHRNEPNLGIFENIEQVRTMPTGNIVTTVAGDDLPGEGWYRRVVEFIQEKGIDFQNELFCIYGDYKCIYPNGDSIVHKQNAVSKYNDAFRLALRGVIGGRGCCYSIKILKKFSNVSQGRSHIAENAMDRQLQIFSEKNYYIPFISNIYFSGIGISTRITEDLKQERMKIWPYSVECFEKMGKRLCEKDILYTKYGMALQEYLFWGKRKKAFSAIWYYLKSFDYKIFRASDTIHGFLFALRRRLPHKRAIHF